MRPCTTSSALALGTALLLGACAGEQPAESVRPTRTGTTCVSAPATTARGLPGGGEHRLQRPDRCHARAGDGDDGAVTSTDTVRSPPPPVDPPLA